MESPVLILPITGFGYLAVFPEFRMCGGYGPTYEDALRQAFDALAAHKEELASMLPVERINAVRNRK